ncbi:unnamed protein product [Sympodiomycopsis kandeliae]
MIETANVLPHPPLSTNSIGQAIQMVAIQPQLPAQGVAGPSSWQQQSLDFYPYIGRKVKRSNTRSRSHASSPRFAFESVINDDGAFNGSCTSTELQSSPLHTMEGTCASYYPDITVYCCSGIHGELTTIPWGVEGEQSVISSLTSDSTPTSTTIDGDATSTRISTPLPSSLSSSSTIPSPATQTNANQEPLCRTTNYNDALACFKLTAETNCKYGQSGLYGLCNSAGKDTSTVTASYNSSSGAKRGVLGTLQWTLLAGTVMTMVVAGISEMI